MDNETPDPKYTQGFNEGYIIAKHLPEFNVTTVNGLENSLRGLGFQHGQKQFLIEKTPERYPTWLKDRSTSLNKAPDKDKNRDIDKE